METYYIVENCQSGKYLAYGDGNWSWTMLGARGFVTKQEALDYMDKVDPHCQDLAVIRRIRIEEDD